MSSAAARPAGDGIAEGFCPPNTAAAFLFHKSSTCGFFVSGNLPGTSLAWASGKRAETWKWAFR